MSLDCCNLMLFNHKTTIMCPRDKLNHKTNRQDSAPRFHSRSAHSRFSMNVGCYETVLVRGLALFFQPMVERWRALVILVKNVVVGQMFQ